MGAPAAGAAKIESQVGYGFMHSAKLEAQIDPQEVDTTCQAQYVSNEAFEAGGGREAGWSAATTVPCSPEDLGEGKNATAGVADIPGGLSLDSVYDYRFLVMSAGKTVYGHLATFTTFGLEEFAFQDLDAQGNPSVQAGGHPYEVSVNFSLNANYSPAGKATYDADLKDLGAYLPPGLIGNPTATPRCPQRLQEEEKCPREDQVGTFGVELIGEAHKGEVKEASWVPLYNLVPPKGVAARFGTVVNGGISAYIDASVRSGSDYGITSASYNITSFSEVKQIALKFWGCRPTPVTTRNGGATHLWEDGRVVRLVRCRRRFCVTRRRVLGRWIRVRSWMRIRYRVNTRSRTLNFRVSRVVKVCRSPPVWMWVCRVGWLIRRRA